MIIWKNRLQNNGISISKDGSYYTIIACRRTKKLSVARQLIPVKKVPNMRRGIESGRVEHQ